VNDASAVRTDVTLADDGAVTSEQRVRLTEPAVPWNEEGARELARTYWHEVVDVTRGLVRVRARGDGIDLRLLGGPALLRFDAAAIHAEPALVSCSYPIAGGLLARRRGGSLTLAQSDGDEFEVRSSVAGFYPRLAVRGALYARGQARIHDAVGRRFLEGLTGKRTR
jgi:hypothetical protein